MKLFTKLMKEKHNKSNCLGVISGLSKRLDINIYVLKLLFISLLVYCITNS